MPRTPRSEQFDPDEVCIVHTVQRCVRRAYLAGFDPVSEKDYGHRREWIRRRLEVLAAVFGIDVLSYAIMSNHLHTVLRTRPDVVETWSDRDVALRWLRLFPGRRLDEFLGVPAESDVERLLSAPERMLAIRKRLSDISWFMRCLAEPIARMANKQDECTGRFWEGRFKAQRLTDEAALLACSMYVDLNPIRAAAADSIPASIHTSAFDRYRAIKGDTVVPLARELKPLSQEAAAERIKNRSATRSKSRRGAKQPAKSRMARDGWLAPLELNERGRPSPKPNRQGVRASDKGFLSLDAESYLQLLDWTGRQGRSDKRGKIPSHVAPILRKLGINGSMWCDLVWNFKRYFRSCAGRPESLKADAERHGRQWYVGQRAAAPCFLPNGS